MFSIKLSLLTKPIIIPNIKKIYVALPVVKKLPVLFSGKISAINKKINGIIKLLFFIDELKKYFLINEEKNTLEKIHVIIKNPITPVSVKISK